MLNSGRRCRLAEASLFALALLMAVSGCTALPSRPDIWRQLSQDIGAVYTDGGGGTGDKVIARQGGGMIVLDTGCVSNGVTGKVLL